MISSDAKYPRNKAKNPKTSIWLVNAFETDRACNEKAVVEARPESICLNGVSKRVWGSDDESVEVTRIPSQSELSQTIEICENFCGLCIGMKPVDGPKNNYNLACTHFAEIWTYWECTTFSMCSDTSGNDNSMLASIIRSNDD